MKENPTDTMILRLLGDGRLVADLDSGHVYSTQQNRIARLGCKNKGGYLVATLHNGKERRQVKLHRVVWLASGQTIPDGMMPDHINRVRDDNRLCNLRVVTPADNSRNRRSYQGENNPAALISASIAASIRERHAVVRSYEKVRLEFGVSRTLVARIVRGELWA